MTVDREMRKAVIQFEAVMKIACDMPDVEKEDEAEIIRRIEEGELFLDQFYRDGNWHWALMEEWELEIPESQKEGIRLTELRSMFLLFDSKGKKRARPKPSILDTSIPSD